MTPDIAEKLKYILMGSGILDEEYNEIIDLMEEYKALDRPIIEKECTTFLSDGKITSATKCQFCDKEKWEH